MCLESRIGKKIPHNHPMNAWLMPHVTMIINTRVRGPDGRTAWERVRGRPFRQPLVGFAEYVMYKHPTKGPQSKPDGNMGTKWGEGIFLGYNRTEGTYTIADGSAIIFARAIARHSPQER